MDFETYKSSVAQAAPPEGLSMAAQALWWEAKGDWHRAHKCAQQQPDQNGAWAHAYLHRVEGDLRNAGGWYGRAGRPVSAAPLNEEWETIARALVSDRPALLRPLTLIGIGGNLDSARWGSPRETLSAALAELARRGGDDLGAIGLVPQRAGAPLGSAVVRQRRRRGGERIRCRQPAGADAGSGDEVRAGSHLAQRRSCRRSRSA